MEAIPPPPMLAVGGPRQTAAALLPAVYDELRRLAAARLAREAPGHTLQPTALVHEAYLRLVGASDTARWDNRGHFFAAAAEAMRRILVEVARRKGRVKHGGELLRVDLGTHDVPALLPSEEVLVIDQALCDLGREDPEAARVVELRFFAGLAMDEVAEALGTSRAAADRMWTFARAWLRAAVRTARGG